MVTHEKAVFWHLNGFLRTEMAKIWLGSSLVSSSSVIAVMDRNMFSIYF